MKKIRSDFNSRQYMLAEDFELYYYSDLNLQNIGNHSHAYYEVYLFSDGCVDMVIEGVKHSLRFVICKNGIAHLFRGID